MRWILRESSSSIMNFLIYLELDRLVHYHRIEVVVQVSLFHLPNFARHSSNKPLRLLPNTWMCRRWGRNTDKKWNQIDGDGKLLFINCIDILLISYCLWQTNRRWLETLGPTLSFPIRQNHCFVVYRSSAKMRAVPPCHWRTTSNRWPVSIHPMYNWHWLDHRFGKRDGRQWYEVPHQVKLAQKKRTKTKIRQNHASHTKRDRERETRHSITISTYLRRPYRRVRTLFEMMELQLKLHIEIVQMFRDWHSPARVPYRRNFVTVFRCRKTPTRQIEIKTEKTKIIFDIQTGRSMDSWNLYLIF